MAKTEKQIIDAARTLGERVIQTAIKRGPCKTHELSLSWGFVSGSPSVTIRDMVRNVARTCKDVDSLSVQQFDEVGAEFAQLLVDHDRNEFKNADIIPDPSAHVWNDDGFMKHPGGCPKYVRAIRGGMYRGMKPRDCDRYDDFRRARGDKDINKAGVNGELTWEHGRWVDHEKIKASQEARKAQEEATARGIRMTREAAAAAERERLAEIDRQRAAAVRQKETFYEESEGYGLF